MYRRVQVACLLFGLAVPARGDTVGASVGANVILFNAETGRSTEASALRPGPTVGGFFRLERSVFELDLGAHYSYRWVHWTSQEETTLSIHDVELPIAFRIVGHRQRVRMVPVLGLAPRFALRQRQVLHERGDLVTDIDQKRFDLAVVGGFGIDVQRDGWRYGGELRASVGLIPRRGDYDGGSDHGTAFAIYLLFTAARS